MPGGILNILATGNQNVFLTGNPKAFFTAVYSKYKFRSTKNLE